MRVVLELSVGTTCLDLALLDHEYTVRQVKEIDRVSDQHSSLALEDALEDFFEDELSNVGVKGRDWVIHQDDVFVGVDGAGEADPCFLTPREVDSFLTDLCGVACR